MKITKIARRILVAEGHTEPLGRVDVINGRTEPPEDFAAESRAQVSTPKDGSR